MRSAGMAASLVVCGVLAFACGSSDSGAPAAPAAEPDGSTAPTAPDDAGPGLAVLPAALTVPVGRSQIFVAPGSAGVAWSVAEGAAGGAVDANGRYTAPETPGTYHVVATAGGLSGTVTVKVANYKLSVLSGAPGGSGFVDGVGAEARLRQPFAITNDGAGTLYLGDTLNGAIRKVVVATGAVTTIAGSASFGKLDGIGAAASFSTISALAVDKVNGVLYVADAGNSAIRAVDLKTAAVTTLAGGSQPGTTDGIGTAAKFYAPSGVAYVDGMLYVSDTGNSTLRRIDLATKQVTTVAGQPASPSSTDGIGSQARFSSPAGITAVDPTLLYLADAATNTVRRISITGGGSAYNVTTYAGSGTAGHVDGASSGAQFSSPTDVAVAGGTVFVCDWTNNDIRSIALATVATFAGTTVVGSTDGIGAAARLARPTGITTDGATLWIADQYNNAIRSIDIATQKVTTLAGRAGTFGTASGSLASSTFSLPAGLVIDKNDDIYMVERGGSDLRTISLAGKTVTPLAGMPGSYGSLDGTGAGAAFKGPQGLALDAAGHLFVADTYNYAIRDVTIASGVVTTPYGTLDPMAASQYVDAVGPAARFGETTGIVVASGKIYVADTGNNVIRQIDPITHSVSTAFGSLTRQAGPDDGVGTAARFSAPAGLATDGDGHLFVADATNATVRSIDLTSGMVTTLAGTAGSSGSVDGLGAQARFVRPTGLFWDGEGSLFVADEGDSTLRRIYVASRAVATFAGQSNQFGVRTGPVQTALLNTPSSLVRTSKGAFVVNSGREGVLLELAPQ
jgi:sugar lactone lactonase YvrE